MDLFRLKSNQIISLHLYAYVIPIASLMGYSFTKSLIVASSSMRLFPNPGVSMTVTFGRDLFPRRCPKSRQVFFVIEVSLRIKSNVFMNRIFSSTKKQVYLGPFSHYLASNNIGKNLKRLPEDLSNNGVLLPKVGCMMTKRPLTNITL